MNKHLASIYEKRINRTIQALEKNGFTALYLANQEELLQKLDEFLPKGTSCSAGGSVTLMETGVIDYLNGRSDLSYYDRYADGVDADDIFHKALMSDVYLMSSNAITEDGKLYNMDGRGNRVAALVYGPKQVLVIAGVNKIVSDIAAARKRNQLIAAPANATRLSCKTPCAKTGFCSDCVGPARICRQELITHGSMIPERITVMLLPQFLGY